MENMTLEEVIKEYKEDNKKRVLTFKKDIAEDDTNIMDLSYGMLTDMIEIVEDEHTYDNLVELALSRRNLIEDEPETINDVVDEFEGYVVRWLEIDNDIDELNHQLKVFPVSYTNLEEIEETIKKINNRLRDLNYEI